MTPVAREGYRVGVPRGGRVARTAQQRRGDLRRFGHRQPGRGAGRRSGLARHAGVRLADAPAARRTDTRKRNRRLIGNARQRQGESRCGIRRTASCRASRTRSARRSTTTASTSRCSPRMPSASSCACSIRAGVARSRATSCPNARTRSGTGTCRRSRPDSCTAIASHGPYLPEQGHRFNPHKLLLDPYAKKLAGTLKWTDALFGYRLHSPRADLSFDRRDSAAAMPKAVVVDDAVPLGRRPRAADADGSQRVLRGARARADAEERTHPRRRARHVRGARRSGDDRLPRQGSA